MRGQAVEAFKIKPDRNLARRGPGPEMSAEREPARLGKHLIRGEQLIDPRVVNGQPRGESRDLGKFPSRFFLRAGIWQVVKRRAADRQRRDVNPARERLPGRPAQRRVVHGEPFRILLNQPEPFDRHIERNESANADHANTIRARRAHKSLERRAKRLSPGRSLQQAESQQGQRETHRSQPCHAANAPSPGTVVRMTGQCSRKSGSCRPRCLAR